MLRSSISTTLTSVCERSRGLISCQLSNTPRRIRSPSARLKSTAMIVIASQLRTSRRSGRRSLDADFEPIIGTDHLQRRALAGQLLIADAFLMHPLNVLVVIGRLMVEQRQPPGSRLMAQVD